MWTPEEPLGPRTTLGIGGTAPHFAAPQSVEEASAALAEAFRQGWPVRILGGGSNTLVPSAGLPGDTAVIQLGGLDGVLAGEGRMVLGAGVPTPKAVARAAQAGLAGLNAVAGVPGQIGGAVAMNAGTPEGEIWDRIESVTLLDPDGTVRVAGRADCDPVYRDGRLGDAVCVEVTLALGPGEKTDLTRELQERLQHRRRTQPVGESSAGCAFRNPDGDSAGRLLDEAGCMGLRVGQAAVSTLHANFILNEGDAADEDVLALIDEMAKRVKATCGVDLVPELRAWTPKALPGMGPGPIMGTSDVASEMA